MEVHQYTDGHLNSNCIFTIFIVFQNERLGIVVCCNHTQTSLTFNAFLRCFYFLEHVYKFIFNPRPLLTFLCGFDHVTVSHTHTDIYSRDEDGYTTKIPDPVNNFFVFKDVVRFRCLTL